MPEMQRLSREYDVISKIGYIEKTIPDYLTNNLNSSFSLREYQVEAITRFIYYLEKHPNKSMPIQLLFNMATGSGKTLLMAANILYLYSIGYRHFLFFVNSVNIIEKTRDNFLNPLSSKYLFNNKIQFEGRNVGINEAVNFEATNENDINIIFTTIQGLHSQLNLFKENSITIEDFADKKIALISDEAHHINTWTRNHSIGKKEVELKDTWEGSVSSILNSNSDNIILEYTATVDINNANIFEKYKEKIIFEYDLKQFRIDGYSKEVKVLESDSEALKRMLKAVILSQYRRKIAEKNGLHLKPVILFKSRSIEESKENYELFRDKINGLKAADIENIEQYSNNTILEKVFQYFNRNNIAIQNLILELKEDFSSEKCIVLDSENINKDKQLKLNTLENEDNEIRAIFVVNMLNEGWDVLNLFDIVRLYDTRDAKGNKPGKTTIAEAQLIGRGARYYPFKSESAGDPFKRKFDNLPEDELKIIEELYYHSVNNPRYIQELTIALKEAGIMPHETKELELRVKDEIKKSDFWNNAFIFINKREKQDRSKLRTLQDINISKAYKYNLATGMTREFTVLAEYEPPGVFQTVTNPPIKLKIFGDAVIRKTMAKLDFYRFNNLKEYFPSLNNSTDFIESLKEISVTITAAEAKSNKIETFEKLNICIYVLSQLEKEIKNEFTEYKGTELFKGNLVKEIVKDKNLKINVGEYSEAEYGKPMSESPQSLNLRLMDKEWYIYNENYGTSEEKQLIRFIDGVINELKKKNYSGIYLLRNESLFSIYNFSDGRPTEPDFVLFLKKDSTDKLEQYQLFIESKGEHLIPKDQWKEDFLKEIRAKYKLSSEDMLFSENKEYKLIGMPFYNDNKKNIFVKEFYNQLNLNLRYEIDEAEKFTLYLPVYSLEAAATAFGKEEYVENSGWMRAEITGRKLNKDMFIAKVVGRSMEPAIPDGSYCAFRFDKGGSRNGAVVLVESRQVADRETNQKYTVKRYHSEKEYLDDGTCRNKRIVLSPDNKEFEPIIIENAPETDFRVIAEFLSVI